MSTIEIDNENDLIDVRSLTIDDASIVYNLIDESRFGLKNLIWAEKATLESTVQFINHKNNSEDKIHGVFQDNNLIGVLELRKKENMFELGYWVGTKYRGQGLMKIAVKNLVDREVQSKTIVAHIREGNKASCKILQYAGLKYDHTELWQNEQWLHLKRDKQQ